MSTRILRVFPRQTNLSPVDNLAFVGDPPLVRAAEGAVAEIHISCAFTWDVREATRLREAWQASYLRTVVQLGGPAIDTEPPGKFEPGLYIKQGVTITSRGCPNHCAFCLVPDREGGIRELEIKPGNIIQDNNILATSRAHFRKVRAMLKTHPRLPQFRGGLEAARLTDWHVEQLRGLRLPKGDGLWFACDTDGADKPLAKAVGKLRDLSRRTLRCYVLCAFGGDTVEKASARLERGWEIGCLPFAQLYQPPDKFIEYGQDWKRLARAWSRPAIMFSRHKANSDD